MQIGRLSRGQSSVFFRVFFCCWTSYVLKVIRLAVNHFRSRCNKPIPLTGKAFQLAFVVLFFYYYYFSSWKVSSLIGRRRVRMRLLRNARRFDALRFVRPTSVNDRNTSSRLQPNWNSKTQLCAKTKRKQKNNQTAPHRRSFRNVSFITRSAYVA